MRIPRALLALPLLTIFAHSGAMGSMVDLDLTKRLDVPESFKDPTPLRWFTVKGVAIKARNKKLAEKIYRLHHSKTANNG